MYLIASFSLLRLSGVLIFDPTGQYSKLSSMMGNIYFHRSSENSLSGITVYR